MEKTYIKKNNNEIEEISTTSKIFDKEQLTIELDLQKKYLEMAQNKIKEIESILKKFDEKK